MSTNSLHTVNIVTLNVLGLRQPKKRKALFQWLIQKQFKIVCLQETFCTAEFKNDFNQNWDGTILHSFTDSVHSRGVCIMMCKDLNCEVLDSRSDQDGHILMIKIKLQDDIYNIINVYAPNNISEWNAFLKQFIVKVENFTAGSDSLILMGDFNTAMTKTDRKSGKIYASTKYLSDCVKQLCLTDIWKNNIQIL